MALGLIEQLGIAGFLLIPLFFLGKWALTRVVSESEANQRKLAESIDQVLSAISVKGQPFRIEEIIEDQKKLSLRINEVFDEDRDMCKQIIATNNHLANDEHWKHCPIDRCPNISVVRDALWRVEAEVLEFKKGAETSRQTTLEKVDSIEKSMKGFANEFISTHKAILDGLLQRRDK